MSESNSELDSDLVSKLKKPVDTRSVLEKISDAVTEKIESLLPKPKLKQDIDDWGGEVKRDPYPKPRELTQKEKDAASTQERVAAAAGREDDLRSEKLYDYPRKPAE